MLSNKYGFKLNTNSWEWLHGIGRKEPRILVLGYKNRKLENLVFKPQFYPKMQLWNIPYFLKRVQCPYNVKRSTYTEINIHEYN